MDIVGGAIDIGGRMYEIDNIAKELDLMRERRNRLVKRRDQLMGEIIKYHQDRGVDSFVHKGKEYHIHEKEVSTRKKAEDCMTDAIKLLETKHGLYGEDARGVYRSMVENQKGTPKKKIVCD